MKARPRRVENKVADYLSAFFINHGHEPVERIPILGRAGPDITYNDVELIVDVKSRKSVPKKFTVPAQEIWLTRYYIITPLNNLEGLVSGDILYHKIFSVMVDRWWMHMSEWTLDNVPSGIPTLVLHRTGKPIAGSTVVIRSTHLGRFRERINPQE